MAPDCFSQHWCSQPASQWNPYRSKPLQAYMASTSLLGLLRFAYEAILALIATTARWLENNASPKAVISGDDFQQCFQPVSPQFHLSFFLQSYAQRPINETLPCFLTALFLQMVSKLCMLHMPLRAILARRIPHLQYVSSNAHRRGNTQKRLERTDPLALPGSP